MIYFSLQIRPNAKLQNWISLATPPPGDSNANRERAPGVVALHNIRFVYSLVYHLIRTSVYILYYTREHKKRQPPGP